MINYRTIVHVDMDAFFTSVEVRDNASLKGKPIVVGADPIQGKGRGVVSAASYEARKFGVRSAQPVATAYKLCPEAIFLPHRFARYMEASNEIIRVLSTFSDTLLRMSIDEAVLDCSHLGEEFGTWLKLGHAIKNKVREETELSCTIGIATGRTLAKMATEIQKPDGLTLVHPGKECTFLAPLAVEAIPGVGPKAKQSLNRLGFRKIGDLQQAERSLLVQTLGKWGEKLFDLVNGRDSDSFTEHERKSFGEERTFETDLETLEKTQDALLQIAAELAAHMRQKNISGRTVTLKIRFADFHTITRSQTYPTPIRSALVLENVALQIFNRNVSRETVRTEKIRLLGIQLSHLYTAQVGEQLWLF